MAAAHYDQSIGADCPNRSETIAIPRNRNRMGGGHGWCYRRHCSDIVLLFIGQKQLQKGLSQGALK